MAAAGRWTTCSLWRTVKYEEVYLQDYGDADDALASLKRYWRFYNQARRHQSLKYRTPAAASRNLMSIEEDWMQC